MQESITLKSIDYKNVNEFWKAVEKKRMEGFSVVNGATNAETGTAHVVLVRNQEVDGKRLISELGS